MLERHAQKGIIFTGMAAEVLKINPRFSIADTQSWPHKHKSDGEAVRNGLRKVGIPEKPPPK